MEYIFHKKVENAKLLKEYQKQKDCKEKDKKELEELEKKQKVEQFLKAEGKLVTSLSNDSSKVASNDSKKGLLFFVKYNTRIFFICKVHVDLRLSFKHERGVGKKIAKLLGT